MKNLTRKQSTIQHLTTETILVYDPIPILPIITIVVRIILLVIIIIIK